MDTSSNQYEYKEEGMNLDYESSTPDPHNTGQVIDSDNETQTTEKLLEEYYKSNINHNHPNFHIIPKKS